MAEITGGDVKSFFVVFAALVVLVSGIISIAKNVKELRKPAFDYDQWRRQTDVKLDNDNKRINEIERADKVMMQSQLAILNHLRTGNGEEKIKEAQDAINNYLVNR